MGESYQTVGASIVPGLAAMSPMTAISGFFMSLLIIMLLWIFYGILLETWKGQTVGKMILGIWLSRRKDKDSGIA
jgi:uncharacterized RDD family membrane protein YckC